MPCLCLTATCSVRRIKCGEEKPSCLRCISTGRKCDGYLPIDRSCSSKSGSTAVASLVLLVSPSENFPAGDRESRSLLYFKARTVPQLSGFFGSEFWECLLLQATHHEPSLRHAVIAIGSLHERFEAGNTSLLPSNQDVDQGSFALKQYNLAIRSLVGSMSKRTPAADVWLIGCILFTSFEVRLLYFECGPLS